jgi:hypothetical protein
MFCRSDPGIKRVDEWTRNDIYDVIDVYNAETVMSWNE